MARIDRRRFLKRASAAAVGAAAFPALLLGRRSGPAIAVLGADDGTPGGRGLTMGIEEAARAAELLRSPLRITAMAAPAAGRTGGVAEVLAADGVVGIVSALPTEDQLVLERDAAAAGLVVVDARAVRPEAPGRPGVFRTGLPATAYGLALLRTLVEEQPAWKWSVHVDGGTVPAISRLAAQVRAVIPAARRSDESGSSAAAGADGVVWIGDAVAGPPVRDAPRSTPTLRFHPDAAEWPQPVAGYRPVLWHEDLFRYGAEQLNARYRERFGAGMTSEAWAGWMGVKALSEAVLRSGGEREQIAAGLGGRRVAFDGHKGTPLTFTGSSGTLAQPLYVISDQGTKEVEWPWATVRQ